MYPNMPYIRPFYCQLKVYFPGAPPSPPMRQSLVMVLTYLSVPIAEGGHGGSPP